MTTIHFYLKFHSVFGQRFFITGNIPELGNGTIEKAFPINYLNEEYWYGSIEVPANSPAFTYQYVLKTDDGSDNLEGPGDRQIDPAKLNTAALQVFDTWNYAGEYENAFFTQAFTGTLLKRPAQKNKQVSKTKKSTHSFRIKAPLIKPGESICLLGSTVELGNWQTSQAIPMRQEGNWFVADVDLANCSFPIAYKYAVWNDTENKFARYEDGNNRTLFGTGSNKFVVLHDGFIQLSNTSFKGAGVAIPVFSLRSRNSLGVGEFADLKPLVDWAKAIGLKLIQLLPLNDTTATHTWVDSYPYSAISAFALHPMFINLEQLAGKKHLPFLEGLQKQKSALNGLADMDYEKVMEAKRGYLKTLYCRMKESWLNDPNYQAFLEKNKHWLLPYAGFCYLRDKYKTSDFSQWQKHSRYNAKAIEKLASPGSPHFDELALHLFIQYHLHLQLQEAVDYAHSNGLVMKGDIPIGIYRNSCDAWVEPELYNMDAQAGAPPDDFAVKGQNWGFPTYNWKKMQEDGFRWWKQRFEQMSHYFDAFRIDHILGFFRIWSIPMHAIEGIMGHFVPCIPVYLEEFAQNGIWFDYDRYCQPFITDGVLNELFGSSANLVKDFYLQKKGWESYTLKPEWNTQRKINNGFDKTGHEDWIKLKLYELVSNVILFEEAGSEGKMFHFRIGVDATLSFRYLDDHTKQQLKELYINYYFRRQDHFWETEALHKLPALKASTNMLICGEDLGMVPDCVPGVMKDLGFLSLEIQRMPKDPNKQFFHPADAPYLSVVTPSTHDMSTIRGWWEEDRSLTQQFYNQQLGHGGEAPWYCEPWICRSIISQHVHSPAMWSIFQLQDLMSMDATLRRENPDEERINVPANPKHYWRYRMHLTLEDLQSEKGFNNEVSQLLQESGRA